MKSLLNVIIAVALFMKPVTGTAQQRPAEPKNISDSINFIWKSIEKDFTGLAEAMPEDKWSFKPSQGEFKGVRSFGEQVKHVACANEAWAKQIMGEKPPARCDLGGPSPAKTKAEILVYLRDSFSLADKAISDTGADNLLHPNPGPYWGTNRLSALRIAAIADIARHRRHRHKVLFKELPGADKNATHAFFQSSA